MRKKIFFNSIVDSMRSWVNEAKENGDINEEQAEAWNDHFTYMEKFHSFCSP